MKILTKFLWGFISVFYLGILISVGHFFYDIGYDKGTRAKGKWIKEIRTITDTIYHFKPE